MKKMVIMRMENGNYDDDDDDGERPHITIRNPLLLSEIAKLF